MVKMDIEKKTGLWMGILVAILSVIYILVTLGKTTCVQYIAVIWSFFLALFLFSEASIITYFQRKDYKRIGIGDIVVFLSIAFGAGILINGLLLINVISSNAPLWVVTFAQTIGLITGI